MSVIVIPAAIAIVRTEDVSVDQLCFEHALSVLRDKRRAGRLRGYDEVTLTANPGLAARGLALPLGTEVRLPEFHVEQQGLRVVRLWDDE